MTTQISKLNEGRVRFQGMVDVVRDKKNIQFIVLKDFSGKIQVTVDKVAHPEVGEVFSHLLTGSTVLVEGELVKSEYVKMGGQEVLADKVEVTSTAEAYPIGPESNIDQRLDYRWIDLRQDKNLLTFKVQSLLCNAMREYLNNNEFVEIHSPKLIATASESGSEVFELKYFDGLAYLAQSPQFYKQMANSSNFGRIYEVAPVFRAEKSHTKKHATEFTSFDLEFSWIESFEDVMALEEEMITYALKQIKEQYGEVIKETFGVEVVVPTLPFPRIKLKDLYAELEKRYGYVTEEEKDDLSTEAERLCAQFSKEAYGHEFLFVTDYGPRKRAFYHLRKDGIPQGYDLIWKGIEITTGAQREHRYEILKEQSKEKGLEKDVEFYLQFFKYGCPPHGGFAIGLDRMTMNLLELATIKDAMFIFRGPERMTP